MAFDLLQRAAYYCLKAAQLRELAKDAGSGAKDLLRIAREYEKLAEQCEKVARALGKDVP